MRASRYLAALLFSLCLATNASSALVLDVRFKDRVATINNDEEVEIWVTLTVDPSSDPLFVDQSSSGPGFGFDNTLVPTQGRLGSGLVDFASYSAISSTFGFSPGGADSFLPFFNPASNYAYSSRRDGGFANEIARSNGSGSLFIAPGESRDYLIRVFDPPAEGANAGTFIFESASIGFRWYGEDAAGNDLTADLYYSACPSRDASCAFTRTVVPLPPALFLYVCSLAILSRRTVIAWIRGAI